MRRRKCVSSGLLAVLLTVLVAFAGCGPGVGVVGEPASEAKTGGTLRVGVHRDPIGMDPHINYGASSSWLQGNVYGNLVEYAEGGEIVPGLAERWENPEPHRYIFHLQRNVVFHDGSPFTAEDVKYTFERVLDPATAATRRPELSCIQRMNVTDPFTIELVLDAPNATLLAVLASPELGMVSKAWTEAGGDFSKAMMGTGPFKLTRYEPTVEYVLEKNERFWKEGLPYVDQVILVPIQDETARMNALKGLEVDFAEYVPYQQWDLLESDPLFTLFKGYSLFNMIMINPTKPPLDNPKVRQALNYAIDRDEIIALAFGGQGTPITVGLIPKGSWAYNDDLDGHWSYDPDKAKRLLAEAGYPDLGQLKLTLESATARVHLDSAEIVVTQFKRLGLDVELKLMEIPTLTEKRVTGDYQLMFDGTSTRWVDPDFYSLFFGSQGTRYAKAVGFSVPRIDQLLTQGRRTLEQDERKQIYHDMEAEILAAAPWIFINFRPQGEAAADYVRGYTPLPGPLQPESLGLFEYIWLDR